jgi:hypothetical protein
MAKKSLSLEGMLSTQNHPIDTGIPQRGAGLQWSSKPAAKAPKKREGEKRLTLALDGETYRRLRMHAAETDQTHQDILETALAEYLNNVIT